MVLIKSQQVGKNIHIAYLFPVIGSAGENDYPRQAFILKIIGDFHTLKLQTLKKHTTAGFMFNNSFNEGDDMVRYYCYC